jgi:hypothetical protein
MMSRRTFVLRKSSIAGIDEAIATEETASAAALAFEHSLFAER